MLANDYAVILRFKEMFEWSGRRDLNPRPPAPKAGALPLRHAPNRSTAKVHSIVMIGAVSISL